MLALTGMRGLGKSSVASRLLERLAVTHQRAVWYGKVDATEIAKLVSLVSFDDVDLHRRAAEIMNAPDLDLTQRIRYLLSGPMQNLPCVFVLDDFETGNLEQRDGGHVLTPEASDVLVAFAHAIQTTGSASRVIVTSCFGFSMPRGVRAIVEPLGSLRGTDLRKKLRQTANLDPDSPDPDGRRQRATETAAGNPRLIEWLDALLSEESVNTERVLAGIETKAEEFREVALIEELLAAQDAVTMEFLGRAAVFELPVPRPAVEAACAGSFAADRLDRAVNLGLIEAATDPASREPHYLVAPLVRPPVAAAVDDTDRQHAAAAAAETLYGLWVTGDD